MSPICTRNSVVVRRATGRGPWLSFAALIDRIVYRLVPLALGVMLVLSAVPSTSAPLSRWLFEVCRTW